MPLQVPEPLAPYLRVGTCSWKYDSWKGLYYDREKKYRPMDYLSDYARHLDSVEIDQWFWSLFPGGLKLPDPGTVRSYGESVPDHFRFTVKAPNALTLTHFYSRQPKAHASFANRSNEHFLDHGLLNRFLETLAPLGRNHIHRGLLFHLGPHGVGNLLSIGGEEWIRLVLVSPRQPDLPAFGVDLALSSAPGQKGRAES